jgi:hypothetical protein
MKARGKREARRPGDQQSTYRRNTAASISAFQASTVLLNSNQGRRASRLPLAFIFRAVGALVHFLLQRTFDQLSHPIEAFIPIVQSRDCLTSIDDLVLSGCT